MNKIILLNKDVGMTSFDAVKECRQIYHEKKVGHTGTLDPNASGLLIILLGKYTKYLPFCVHNHKHYIATFELGYKTDTEDKWGTIIEEKPYNSHTQEELNQISNSMIGKQTQIPPMYSAKKINGEKLYDLARKGIEIERKPIEIEVSKLDVKKIGDNLYEMDTIVSSGTYIRTLIQDYCMKMNELASMTSLVRIGIEHVSLNQACTLEELKQGNYTEISPFDILEDKYVRYEIDSVEDVKNGKKLKLDIDEPYLLLTNQEEILAIYEKRDDLLYHCVRGLF